MCRRRKVTSASVCFVHILPMCSIVNLWLFVSVAPWEIVPKRPRFYKIFQLLINKHMASEVVNVSKGSFFQWIQATVRTFRAFVCIAHYCSEPV